MSKIMKGILLIVFSYIVFGSCAFAQKKANPFQRVAIPDSIYLKLENAYNKNTKNVNAGRNVFNLINRKDFGFKDGLFSFQGQGPHFPRRIFIFNKGLLFIFDNEGAFNPKGVLQEFVESIKKLGLTDKQTVRYSKAISEYLEQESGNTYGQDIK
ncbi:MAG: hypothetical protein B7Y37_01625 [Sphingobacteriia bacterium 28-36-52]|nr:MAG: hypothetical protein B7Y37_01625 [Sphingobacteriia bacterium 28-36-52]